MLTLWHIEIIGKKVAYMVLNDYICQEFKFKQYFMSKKDQQKEEVALPQSPTSYSYKGNEMISIPADVFMLMWRANEDAIQASITRRFFSVPQWVSAVTGEVLVATPTQEELKSGLVRQATSLEKTFDMSDTSNFHESFEDWVYPNIINAKVAINEVHGKMIETGVATSIEELQAQAQAEQKAQAAQTIQAEGNYPNAKDVEAESEDAPKPKGTRKPAVQKPKGTRKPRAKKD